MQRVKIESYQNTASGWHYVYKPEDMESALTFGDIKADCNGNYTIIELTSWGDYCGSLVERSNFNVLCDTFKEILNSRGLFTVSGWYSSRAILLDLRWLADSIQEDSPDHEYAESLRDILEGLDNYPVIDEDDYNQLCFDTEQEDWDSFIESDLKRALLKVGIDTDSMSDDDFIAYYQKVCEDNNIYWESESAVAGYINIDEIVKHW